MKGRGKFHCCISLVLDFLDQTFKNLFKFFVLISTYKKFCIKTIHLILQFLINILELFKSKIC